MTRTPLFAVLPSRDRLGPKCVRRATKEIVSMAERLAPGARQRCNRGMHSIIKDKRDVLIRLPALPGPFSNSPLRAEVTSSATRLHHTRDH